MAAESGGAAGFDRRHHAALRDRQRSAMLLTIGVAVAAEHIRHFRARDRSIGPALRSAEVRRVSAQGRAGRGSRSSGLVVAHTLVVAIRR